MVYKAKSFSSLFEVSIISAEKAARAVADSRDVELKAGDALDSQNVGEADGKPSSRGADAKASLLQYTLCRCLSVRPMAYTRPV